MPMNKNFKCRYSTTWVWAVWFTDRLLFWLARSEMNKNWTKTALWACWFLTGQMANDQKLRFELVIFDWSDLKWTNTVAFSCCFLTGQIRNEQKLQFELVIFDWSDPKWTNTALSAVDLWLVRSEMIKNCTLNWWFLTDQTRNEQILRFELWICDWSDPKWSKTALWTGDFWLVRPEMNKYCAFSCWFLFDWSDPKWSKIVFWTGDFWLDRSEMIKNCVLTTWFLTDQIRNEQKLRVELVIFDWSEQKWTKTSFDLVIFDCSDPKWTKFTFRGGDLWLIRSEMNKN